MKKIVVITLLSLLFIWAGSVRAEKVLNNFVTELLNVSPKVSKDTHSFRNPRHEERAARVLALPLDRSPQIGRTLHPHPLLFITRTDTPLPDTHETRRGMHERPLQRSGLGFAPLRYRLHTARVCHHPHLVKARSAPSPFYRSTCRVGPVVALSDRHRL